MLNLKLTFSEQKSFNSTHMSILYLLLSIYQFKMCGLNLQLYKQGCERFYLSSTTLNGFRIPGCVRYLKLFLFYFVFVFIFLIDTFVSSSKANGKNAKLFFRDVLLWIPLSLQVPSGAAFKMAPDLFILISVVPHLLHEKQSTILALKF